jgi:hypothetical protein
LCHSSKFTGVILYYKSNASFWKENSRISLVKFDTIKYMIAPPLVINPAGSDSDEEHPPATPDTHFTMSSVNSVDEVDGVQEEDLLEHMVGMESIMSAWHE